MSSFTLRSSGPKASLNDLAIFTRQLTTLFDAGVQLTSALDFYARSEKSQLATVVQEVGRMLHGGHRLSHAMSRYPTVFNAVYIGLVRTGEVTGNLSEMLGQIADLLERQSKFEKKVVAAFTYPLMLGLVCLLCAALFIYVILPSMEPMYQSMHIELPLPTRILLGIGQVARSPVVWAGVILALITGPRWWAAMRKIPWVRVQVQELPFRLPGLGELFTQIMAAKILFTMATSLNAGVGLLQTLELASEVADNERVQSQFELAKTQLREGESLSKVLSAVSVLPTGAVSMLIIGEETGSLAAMASSVARIYEEGTEHAIDTFAALMEPLMMLLMGLMTGFLVLSAILPVVRLLETLS